METGIHNTSEIGRLRKVLLHRPGQELENLMPEYLERLLFDDIPYSRRRRRNTTPSPNACGTRGWRWCTSRTLWWSPLTGPEVRQALLTQFFR